MDDPKTFSITDSALPEDAAIVEVAGEIDMARAPSFQHQLLRALGAGRHGLVVDLSAATFMDSAALNSLVTAFEELRARGGRLAIVAPDTRVRALFEVARLDRDFEIYDSRAEALASVTGGAA